ncbi:MAG: hypothetical protein IJH25_08300 [Clostridia bacterium]|nr:hypothetical protein [Clostridia bacterium]MBQ6121602.1 hypothetical protein [Clostridia bacterium]
MKKTNQENIAQDTETAGKAVATPKKGIPDETVAVDSAETFEVRPSETVSIVAGNRVLFLGEGLREIRITK